MPLALLTIGEVARRLDVAAWQIRRVITRGILAEPSRLGVYRIFYIDDLPRVEAALRVAGYLPQKEPTNAA